MGPRKRLKVTKCSSVKVENSPKSEDLPDSFETEHALQNPSENYPALYLSLLPNEVLLCIYRYLSPVDLLSLSQLEKRFSDLTYSIKEADFSSCRRRANPQQVSTFFCRNRLKYITKLNFSYAIFLKPPTVVQLICRCKNLKGLSIVECGIKHSQIVQILRTCTKLEKLAWDVAEVVQSWNALYPNMKTVYLFCDIRKVSLNSVYFTVKNFPNVENVFINFASDSITLLPFIGIWLMSSCVSSNEFSRRYTLITNSFQCLSLNNDLHFLHQIIVKDSYSNDTSFSPVEIGDSIVSRMYNCPPYLQIQSKEEDISLLSSGPCHAYSSLVIIITPEIEELCESLIKCTQEVAGYKLKHLSLQSEACYLSDDGQHPMPISSAEAFSVCTMLDKMFVSCKNITVLNIATVHFCVGSPFKAICQLQNLRVLNIPSCAFKTMNSISGNEKFKKLYCEFKQVVSSCPKVQYFLLAGCMDDLKRVTEVDMIPMKDWEELKHLSMYSIIFRTCSFLKNVVDSCKQLQSLSLISVVPANACIFINDVIYVLKTARNLSFIRINEIKFNPMFERFWDAIGTAVNLEGICIITQSKTHVETQTVMRGIKKLKYLHLFHFFASRASERLYAEVKKSMQEHGVNNIKIERFCNINSFNRSSRLQFYHQQPHFCCQHLHFKDIDI